VRRLRRGGRYFRVADPEWDDPLEGRFAQRAGGRWNPPGSFPVVYLCASVAVARANVFRKLTGLPYGPEDLHRESAPVLVSADVPRALYVDAVTDRGLEALGLPQTYPRTTSGRVVGHRRCHAIGRAAWDAGERGIAGRSAAPTAPPGGEELAWFERRGRRLAAQRTEPFEQWFW
jgi:RES domain-containing protein